MYLCCKKQDLIRKNSNQMLTLSKTLTLVRCVIYGDVPKTALQDPKSKLKIKAFHAVCLTDEIPTRPSSKTEGSYLAEHGQL